MQSVPIVSGGALIAPVQYAVPDVIKSRFSGLAQQIIGEAIHTGSLDLAQEIQSQARILLGDLKIAAELLLFKREAFKHEEEVRVVIASQDVPTGKDLLRITVDPNELFDEVTFDPRLVRSELEQRKQSARDLGYAGGFRDSDLYDFTHLHIRVRSSDLLTQM